MRTNSAEHALAAAPPVAVSGFTLAGIGLSDWVLILTALYTALQIGWFVYEKAIRPRLVRRRTTGDPR